MNSPCSESDSADLPGYWQQRYERGEDRWDKEQPAPPLLEYLAGHRLEGKVLVPGCGAGHDVRALARAGLSVVGLDFAPAALERAHSFPRVAQEEYELANFLALPEHLTGQFDGLFEHTLFCAIPPHRRPDYVRSCFAALRPGGWMLAIFYLNPGHEDGPPWGVTREALDELFAPYFDPRFERVPGLAYEGREGRELLRLSVRKNEVPTAKEGL